MGLSGSGKTTYAMNFARYDSSVFRINLDALQSSRGIIETLNSLNSFYGSSKTYIYMW
jgi:predicted kinase